MKKRVVVGIVAGALAASAATGAYVVKPMAEKTIAPLVKEQLNNAVRGTISYDTLEVGWLGQVLLSQVDVKDEKNKLVAQAKEVSVGLSPMGVLRILLEDAGAVAALGTIRVQEPIVYAQEYGDRSWNIEHIIKKTDDSKPMDYKGTVHIVDGILEVENVEGARATISDVNGALKFEDYPSLKGAVSAKVGEDSVKISGSYLLKGSADFDVSIETSSFDLKHLKPFVSLPKELKLSKAFLKDTTARIIRNDDYLRLAGTANLADVSGTYGEFRIDQGSADIKLDGPMLKITRSELRLNENLLTAAGSVNLGDTSYPVHGTIQMPMGRIESFLPDQGVEGEVKASAIVDGTLKDLVVSGKASSQRLSVAGSDIYDVKANYSYDHGILSVTEGSLKKDGGEGTGYGLYRIGDASYEGHISVDKLEVAPFSSLAGVPLAGTMTGNVFFAGSQEGVSELSANVSGTNVSVEGIDASSADAFVSGKNGVYTIHHSLFSFADGVATISGDWSPEKMNLSGTVRAVPMEAFHRWLSVPVSGTIEGVFYVAGSPEAPVGDFSFGVANGKIEEIPFESGAVKGSFTKSQVHLEDAILNTKPGIYSATGDIGIGADDPIHVKVSVDNARAESLVKPFSDLPITGWVSGNAWISGTRNNPIIDGEAVLREGSFYGELISELSVKASLRNQIWDVERISLAGYDSEVHGRGRIVGDQLDFIIGGDAIQLNRVFRNERYAVKGTATIVGKLEGTLENPVFQGQFGASRLSINDVDVQSFGGNVYADRKTIYTDSVHFVQDGGVYEFSGGIRLPQEELFGKASVKKGNVGNLIRLFQLPIHSYEGHLSGTVELGGVLTNPRVDVRGKIEDSTIKGKTQGDVEVDATLANKELEIRKLSMPLGDGYLAAEGKADFKDELSLQLAANNVPVELLAALTGKELAVTGTLNGVVNATGKTDNPDVQLSLNLEGPTYNGVKMDHVYAMLTMKDWQIRIRQFLVQRGTYKGTIYGQAPFSAIFPKYEVGEDRNVNLKVNLSEAGLGVLPLLNPAITAGEGPLDGIVEITGPLDNLHAKGTISVANGSLTFKGVKKPLERISGSMILSGQAGSMNFSGQMGKGTATVKGEADWTGGPLHTYHLEANSNGLEVDSPYFKGPLDAQLSITSGQELPHIKGFLDLHDVTMDIPLVFASEKSEFDANLDVEVKAGNNVRFYNSVLYDLRVSGRAHYGWRLSFPRAEGKFTVDKGSVRYLNNRFQLIEGEAAYNDIGTFLPSLMVRADTNVNHYRIHLALDGMPTALQMKLTSEPALTEQQIVSLLTLKTTGRNTDGVDQNEVSNLVSAGLEMAVFGPVENLIQNQLNLDQVRISSTRLDPYTRQKAPKHNSSGPEGTPMGSGAGSYYSLEMGKYVLPNTMLTYGVGLNYNLSKFGVAYEVGRSFNLNAWYTTEQNYYFGGQWRYRF